MRKTAVCLVFVLFCALLVNAQVSTSSVTGVVTDASGAVVSNAKVEVKNESTGQTYNATTSDTGKYTIPSVIPGLYSVTITAQGFQRYASMHNTLNVGQPLVVNANMSVGAANETVEVQSNYERIETTNATISDVITEKQVKNLPLNGRNPLTLLTLEPGVVQRPSGSSGSGTHVFGSRDRAHNVTIDGIDANESTVPNPQSNIQRLNPDNVQEFRTVTLNATAETGRNSGANVMIATKAGSNGIHGDVYEFLRNNALNSNEWYNTANKLPVPKLNLNQFGFDVGGPLIKNKTFWFASFQHNIIKESAPIASFFGVPTTYTPTLRQGIFRYVKGTVTANGVNFTKNDTRLVDAAGNLVAGVVPCASSSSTNCIASYNINAANDPAGKGPDTAMQGLANSLPTPNAFSAGGDGLNYAGYLWNPPTKFTGPNYLIRLDHTIGPNDNIFGHWLQNHYNTTQGDFTNARPMVYPGFAPLGEALRLGRNLAVSYRHTFTPNLVNEFTMGFNRFAFAFTFGESDPNFPKIAPYSDDCVYGSTTLMTPPGCVSAKTQRAVTTPQFIDNISWTHGAHTFHAGINFRMYYHNDARGFFGSTITYPGILFSRSSRLPNFCNGPCSAGNPVISAANLGINSTDLNNLNQAIVELAGVPSSLRKSFVADFGSDKYASTPYATVYSRAHQYDSYIQDEWKVRQNLTVNAGLRWEYNPAPFDAKQALVPNKPIDGSQGPVTFVKADRWFKNNNAGAIGPRVGIAWAPNDKTSVRLGYSWLFDTISTFQVTAMAGKVPGFMLGCNYSISTSGTLSNSAGCAPAASLTGLTNRLSGGFPMDVPAPVNAPSVALAQPVQSRGTAPSVGAFDPNLKNPSVHEWTLSIQRELPLHVVGEIGYVGKRGTHLYRGYDANQIDPLSHAGFLDSFNIAHANVLAGCNPDGTKPSSGSLCPTGGTTPTMLLSLVTPAFLNSSSSISDFTINNIGNLAIRMDNLASNDAQRTANLPLNYFRPNPQFNQIFYQDSGGDSYYHGLIVSARRRFEQGLTFGLSYTFSKSIDDLSIDPTGASTGGGLSTTGSTTPTDIRNFRLDRAVSDFDNKHVLVGSMYYELPVGKGKKFAGSAPGWINQIIGGWSLTQIFNYQSGEPFTVYAGTFTTNSQHNSTAVLVGDKPGSSITYNVPGIVGPVLYRTGGFISAPSGVAPGTVANLNCQVFASGNTKFCIPAAGQQGERRNSFRGPDFWNIDGGLLKNFKMTERFALQFRAEIFNMLNHPNFENPRNASVGSPNIQSSNFGTVCCTTAAVQSSSQVNPIGEPSRVIQLGLKLSF